MKVLFLAFPILISLQAAPLLSTNLIRPGDTAVAYFPAGLSSYAVDLQSLSGRTLETLVTGYSSTLAPLTVYFSIPSSASPGPYIIRLRGNLYDKKIKIWLFSN